MLVWCGCVRVDSTAQHSTAQHSTAQHSTAQHSTAQEAEDQDQDHKDHQDHQDQDPSPLCVAVVAADVGGGEALVGARINVHLRILWRSGDLMI